MRTKASISFKKRVLLLLTSCMFITLFSSTVSAEEISIQRISGGNRYETALKIAEEVNPDSTEFLLVSGENYPDALAGAPLSKGRIPILLTSKNSLDSQALTKLRNLSKPKVTILGGELTISSEVTTELQNEGILYKRISGQNRYETAALIAKEIRTNQIYVASGLNFPDALSGSALALENKGVILLGNNAGIPTLTKDYLESIEAPQLTLFGGELAFDQETSNLYREFDKNLKRYFGDTRYDTSMKIAENFHNPSTIILAAGEGYPDALAGSALAGKESAPILLIQKNSIPNSVEKYIKENRENLQKIYILGGVNSISAQVEQSLKELMENKGESSDQENDAPIIASTFYSRYDKGSRVGLMDSKGNILIEPKYRFVSWPSEGKVAAQNDQGKWSILDISGNELAKLENDYQHVGFFSEGLAPVRDKQGKEGYIDSTGRVAIPLTFDNAGEFWNGVAFVKHNGTANIFNKDENTLTYIGDADRSRRIGKDYFLGGEIQSDVKRVIDVNGNELFSVSDRYINLYPLEKDRFGGVFNETDDDMSTSGCAILDNEGKTLTTIASSLQINGSLGRVYWSENIIMVYANGEIKFYDTSGKNILPKSLAYADAFNHGVAPVSEDRKEYYLIDKEGNRVQELGVYDAFDGVGSGLYLGTEFNGADSEVFLIDKTGKIIKSSDRSIMEPKWFYNVNENANEAVYNWLRGNHFVQ